VVWCALESVVAASDLDNVASVSVRSLATELGVSKNTAQRAVAALRAARLITPLATRRDAGKFAAGAYRLAVPTAVLARVDASAVVSLPAMPAGADTASAAPSAPVAPASSDFAASRRSRRSRVRPVVVEQLSLLPEV